jgi:hypothetical protein
VVLLSGVVLGLLAALVVGASWRGFAEVRWRLAPLILLGLVLQFVLFSQGGAIIAPLIPFAGALHLLSYALVLASLIANWRLPGVAILLTGALLNFIVIAANGGQMPRLIAPDPAVFTNVAAMDANTRLVLLGDWIPVFGRLISIGDILIASGGAIVAYSFARAKRPDHSAPSILGRSG